MLSLQRIDQNLTKLVARLPRSLNPLMSGLSYIGDPSVVMTIVLGGFTAAAFKSDSRIQRAIIYSLIAFGLITALKIALHRPRPHGLIVKTLGISSYSFPSGHAFGSVIFYGQFASLDIKYLTRPWNMIIATVLWLIIFLIGVSRVYSKFHYPSDVLAGWLIGLVSLIIVNNVAY